MVHFFSKQPIYCGRRACYMRVYRRRKKGQSAPAQPVPVAVGKTIPKERRE